MPASDMLDVLHFYFEEDNSLSTEAEVRTRSRTRELLYGKMYGRPYRYAYTPSEPQEEDDEDDFESDEITPFNPKNRPVKEYIPPTPFDPDSSNPFGTILDAPLG